MIVELVPAGGIGRNPEVRVAASQVVVRHPNGTPLCVVAMFADGYAVSKVGDEDFNRTLRNLGVPGQVTCDTLEVPAPQGRRIISPQG